MIKKIYLMLISIVVIQLIPSYSFAAEFDVCQVESVKELSKCKRGDILTFDQKSGYNVAKKITERGCDYRYHVSPPEQAGIVNCIYVGYVRKVK